MDNLKETAKRIRKNIVTIAYLSKSAHVGSALSCVDILVALLFERMQKGDSFILSKGHGCMAYYAALKEKGEISEDLLMTYSQNGSILAEHPLSHGVPGIDWATGSLGHGLSLALGVALSKKIRGEEGLQYVLLSDGECNEGSVWEAAMVASNLKLDNLVGIVDYNKIQAAGFKDKDRLFDKWKSFGWNVFACYGNVIENLLDSIRDCNCGNGAPSILIADTTKGKGVSFMENDLLWHYRPPSEEELRIALEEIENA